MIYPGIGPARRKDLMRQIFGVWTLCETRTVETLKELPSMNESSGDESVYKFFPSQDVRWREV